MSHSYFITGEREEGIANATEFIERELGLAAVGNPDVMVFRHGLFSVDDARALRARADLSPTTGDHKVLIVSTSRLFHEAQNALLKLFEEPPAGTTLILIIPAEGMLLPTLRSRLQVLPSISRSHLEMLHISDEARTFINARKPEREKITTKILDRAKSDKDDEKQAARLAAIHLAEGLTKSAYQHWQSEKSESKQKELQNFLDDLNAFLPILHERSAPLKLIFEHIQLTIPESLAY
jgi:hypothetical protein